MVKAYELRSLSKDELLKTLTDLRKELAELHVAKVTDGAATKVTKIKGVRKSIARVLTVHNQQQKDSLRKAASKAKYVPKDLRSKKTRAMRRALTTSEKSKKTHRERCRLAAFPKVKYAIKASA
jgi:large subunit ribosomal protein L35e